MRKTVLSCSIFIFIFLFLLTACTRASKHPQKDSDRTEVSSDISSDAEAPDAVSSTADSSKDSTSASVPSDSTPADADTSDDTASGVDVTDSPPATTESPGSSELPSPSEPVSKAEQILKSMTVEEKVGQLFFLRPEALTASNSAVLQYSQELQNHLQKYGIGGIILFSQNLKNPQQTQELIRNMQNACRTGLFIGVDEEGGRVARIGNQPAFRVPTYPDMGILSEQGKDAVYQAALTIGSYLKSFGFNLNFAPVADVNTNPENPIIGSRAFSSDPQTAAELVSTAIRGFHDGGVLCTVKHFPGHGDTLGDSHTGEVFIDRTLEELWDCELIPFQAGIAAGTDMVMVGHITAQKITNDDIPASLSYKMITGVLREKLQYDGVVITDGLEMKSVTERYSSGEAAVMAIEAGVDILLLPANFEEAYSAVLQSVQTGRITEQRLEQSVLRILKLKEKAGLL